MPTLLRQSIYSRLAGYEDVNDAERLSVDPVLRAITGKKAPNKQAASVNTMGRFETEFLTQRENLAGLSEINLARSIFLRVIVCQGKPDLTRPGFQTRSSREGVAS